MTARPFAAALVLLALAACGYANTEPPPPTDGGQDAGEEQDGGAVQEQDAGTTPDAGPPDSGTPDAGPTGICSPGQTRACYPHGSGTDDPTIGQGACQAGTQSCVLANGVYAWGICSGHVTPQAETCNGLDDDCNGTVDDTCPGGIELVAAGESGLYGGSGGTPFEANCAPGAVRGFSVKYGTSIDRLEVQCGELNVVPSNTEPSGYAVTVTPTANLGPYGGTGGSTTKSFTCPANTVASGFFGWHGTRVDSLGIECSRLTVIQDAQGYSITRTYVSESMLLGSNGGSSSFDLVCSGNGVMNAFKGTANPYLYKIGGKCSTPTLTGP
jgi:hypothetical protein